MTSEELSDQVTNCIESLRGRIMGVGREQYSADDHQMIEDYSDKRLLDETLAELDDALVYIAVLRSRLAFVVERFHV